MASGAVNVAVAVDHKNTDIRNAAHGVRPILCMYTQYLKAILKL